MSSPLAEAFLMDSLNSCYETPSKLFYELIVLFLMNFAGLPPHTSLAGISLVTTEEAATSEFSPMITPLQTTLLHPRNEFLQNFTEWNLGILLPASRVCANIMHRAVILTPLR